MIIDSYNRSHDYLRISLTDKCDLRCFYCMPDEHYDFAPMAHLMQEDEILRIAKIFTDLGVKKIRLTGGEPLVRKDAGRIILGLSELPVELTMTTNGTRLHLFQEILNKAGVRSVNISLDTLHPQKFSFYTRRNQFDRVMENIRMMVDEGVHVKINMVVMKGKNDQELPGFVEWTRKEPVHVRFIEFMPFTGNRWDADKVFTWKQMLEVIGKHYTFKPLAGEPHETAKKYSIDGHQGTFAVISTMSAPFCSDCNRMRLTADGKMKNCLFSKSETDLLSVMRNGGDLVDLIHHNVLGKKKALGGQFNQQFDRLKPETINNRSMISIGG